MSLFQYNVVALMVGGTAPYSPNFESIATRSLEGIQSASITLSYPRTDIVGWDGNGDQEMVDRPRADLNFSYVFASGVNERNLGFTIGPVSQTPQSALAMLTTSERNYYLVVNTANQDEVGYAGTQENVLALGNGVINRYEFASQVGQPAMVNVGIQGLNVLLQPTGSGQPLPAIYKQSGTAPTGQYTLPIATRTVGNYFDSAPGNIILSFHTGSAMGALLSGQNACPIESFSFSIDIPRTDVKDMGWAYPEYRPIQWPVTINVQATARLSQFQLDSLNRYGCPDSGYAFTVGFRNSCSTIEDFSFRFTDLKLETESLNVAVGGGTANATFSWSLKIHDMNRVADANPNLFLISSGTPYSSIVFPQVDYVSGSSPLTFNLGTSCFLSILSGPGFLDANNVYVTDEAATVIVRAAATDGSDTQNVTVTIS